jgi:glycosyltransferase involved in cell wall biosynthesis
MFNPPLSATAPAQASSPMQRGRSAAVVAFSCRPRSGSEWGLGWNYLVMIARLFDAVTLFVRDAEHQVERTRAGLTEAGIDNVEIVPVRDLSIYRLFNPRRIHVRFLTVYYAIWLYYVLSLIVRDRTWRRRTHLFHVTWVSDWLYSPLFLLPFRRRIVGPIGSQPANFNRESPDYWPSRLRFAGKFLFRVLSPNIVSALRADAVFGISAPVVARFPWRLCRQRAVITPVHSELSYAGPRLAQRKLVFLGKNLPFKNLDLVLDVAVPLLHADPDLTLEILGDTLDRAPGGTFSIGDDLRSRVTVHGMRPSADVARFLGGYQSILLQLSAETGGTVGVEGLCLGVPVVCVQRNGIDAFFEPGAYPYAVPYSGRQQLIADAGALIRKVFDDYPAHSARAAALGQRLSLAATFQAFQTLVERTGT